MSAYEKYKVDVPEGISGNWKVERFEVTEEDEKFQRLRALFSAGRYVPAGHYTRLTHNNHVVMSDTPDEISDVMSAVWNAKGNVLINGLGLGIVTNAILQKPEVEHVTVIEISLDVIALVAEHYKTRFGNRLEVILADAFEWKPPKGKWYNAVWHDIWNDICSDNLAEMHKLHRKYGRRADWQGSWCRHLCERYK